MTTPTTLPASASFKLRPYSKSELASMYLPNVTPNAARRTFMAWINLAPGLSERLKASGLTTHSHYFTPHQVSLIVDALGEP